MPNSADKFTTTFFHHFTAKLTETGESEEGIFLTQSSFHGAINPGNDLEKLLSSKNLEEDDYENTQFSIEEAKEGLFSFHQADEYAEV